MLVRGEAVEVVGFTGGHSLAQGEMAQIGGGSAKNGLQKQPRWQRLRWHRWRSWVWFDNWPRGGHGGKEVAIRWHGRGGDLPAASRSSSCVIVEIFKIVKTL